MACFVVRREVKRGPVGEGGVLDRDLEVNDGKSGTRRRGSLKPFTYERDDS